MLLNGKLQRTIGILWLAGVLEDFLQKLLKKGGIKMSRIMRAMVILVIAGGLLNAQSGPSWVPQGNLDGAGRIWGIF